MEDNRKKLIYLVSLKKQVADCLLMDVPGFNILAKNIDCLSFLDRKISLGFFDKEIF